MPRIAITDYTFPDLEIEQRLTAAAGIELSFGQCKTPPALIPLVREAEAVITQFSPVNAEVIGQMEKTKVIVRYGIGVDNIDLEAARSKGIPVCNIPDYCIHEVADHTLAMILAATRQVIFNHQYIREGNWGIPYSFERMKALRDLTVGLVGFGRIGREVSSRLKPFGCRQLIFDPVVSADSISQLGCESADFEQILAESDLVTLHCPSSAKTRKMLNREAISRLKRGSILVNVSRGDLVDTNALIEALQDGQVGFASLDVCDPEPIPQDSPLRTMPNVVLASHLASVSERAVRVLRETAVTTAIRVLKGENPINVVNGVV